MNKYSVIDYAVEPPVTDADLLKRFTQKIGRFYVREEGGLEVAFREPDVLNFLGENHSADADPAYAAHPLGNFYSFLHGMVDDHKRPSSLVRRILAVRQKPDSRLPSYTRMNVLGVSVKSAFDTYLKKLGLETQAVERQVLPESDTTVWEPPQQILPVNPNIRDGKPSSIKKGLYNLGFRPRKKRE